MSVVGLDQILELVKLEEALLENLGARELNNPEGVGLDLRLGSIHKIIEGGAYIEVDGEAGLGKRKGVKTKEIAKFTPGLENQPEIIIKPGEYYLVQTFESVNTPQDLMPLVFPRSSLFRAGLLLLNSKTDPGYKGVLTMGLTNLSPFEVKLQMGARICNMVFFRIEGKTVNYRGQHQGGRVSPHEVEQQV
jgi:deoxycytidine triphosphate deaminase